MCATVGSFIAHPEKSGSNNVLEQEAAHFQAQHKRNVSFTASMHAFQLNLLNGIPEQYNLAVIDDITDEQGTILGLNNIITGINDALIYNANIPFTDRIICDVPCSGLGIIRRKPEIRYKNLDDIKELPQIQYNILFTSSRYLKSGGVIIYSTCTLNKKENEQVVDRFLNDNTDFSLVESKTVFPTKNGGDGFFYSILKKKND